MNNPEHHPAGDFKLLSSGLIESEGENKLTFSGIGIYHPDLFKDYVNGKRALAPVLRKAMQEKKISGEFYQGQWQDIGTPERLNELDLYLKSN